MIEHYIDIGANHPVRGNASIAFYLKGATGYLIEANPKYRPMYSLNHIMQFCEFYIDYISIDVESLEYSILRDFDFDKYKVRFFNVEKHGEQVRELLEKNNYKVFAETPSNWLFERQE